MDIPTLIVAVAALGLPCTNPELRDYPLEERPAVNVQGDWRSSADPWRAR
jgi:hypothetical protein